MGKKSKKKTGSVAHTTNGNSNATTNNNAATRERGEEMEPIAEFNLEVWQSRFPFADKTSDPLAKDLDKAHALFLEGIQYANNNDLSLASEYIASAYVLNEKVVLFQQEEYNDERVLDLHVLASMLGHLVNSRESGHSHSLAEGILILIMALANMEHNLMNQQAGIATAMQYMNDLLGATENMMKTSPLGQLGGLTHAKLYYWRGRLFKEIVNGKSALKDWNKALELDPSLVVARLERLRFWMATKMKVHSEIHAECLIFLGFVHEDYEEIDIIYMLLASSTYADPSLGTYAQAMEYYKKSLQTTSRRFEVYGPRVVPDDIIRHLRRHVGPSYECPDGNAAVTRKQLDVVMFVSPMSAKDKKDFKRQQQPTKTKRNMCLNCHKDEASDDGIQLRKCSRCRHVYYCSTECIRANWKEHKAFCHPISEYKNSH